MFSGFALKKINAKIFFCIIYAILSTGGIAYYLAGNNGNNINKIIYIAIFVLYYNICNKMTFKSKKMIVSGILSLITSTIMFLGNQLEIKGDIDWGIFLIVQIIMLTLAVVPLYDALIGFLDKFHENVKKQVVVSKRSFLFTWGILFFFGFLGYLALYPGMYGYDAPYQILQIQCADIQVTTHFSVIYSYVLCGFVNIGTNLFNSPQAGIAIYSFVQMCILTYITARICTFSYKITDKKIIWILSTVFFCIFPPHIVMMVSSAQDSIFCGILALISINAYEIVYDNEKYFDKVYNYIKYVLLLFIFCIMKNNGIYIIMVPAVLTIFLIRKNKLKTFFLYIIAISLFLLYRGPILNALNVVEGNTTMEMMSIPCQQFARSYTYNSNVYTESDKELLSYIFSKCDGDPFKEYINRASISDPVKGNLDEKFVNENKKRVGGLYVRKMLKDPENFTEAFLLNSLGFWYPDKTYEDTRIYHPYIEFDMVEAKKFNDRYIEIGRNSILPIYNNALNDVLKENKWKYVPVVSTLFTCGTYFFLLLIATFYCLYSKKIGALYILSILWGYYLTLLLSPVCIFRYCYALILVAPFMISLCIKKGEE